MFYRGYSEDRSDGDDFDEEDVSEVWTFWNAELVWLSLTSILMPAAF